MIDSIDARHAREQAEQRRLAREAIADTGPSLANDDTTLVIPSPARHKEFSSVLNAYGFTFERGVCPWWQRDIAKSFNGRTYSPAEWLNWATRRYSWAWPEWDDGRLD